MKNFINKIFNSFITKVGIEKLLNFAIAGYITALCGFSNEIVFGIVSAVIGVFTIVRYYIDKNFGAANLFWTIGGIMLSVVVYVTTYI